MNICSFDLRLNSAPFSTRSLRPASSSMGSRMLYHKLHQPALKISIQQLYREFRFQGICSLWKSAEAYAIRVELGHAILVAVRNRLMGPSRLELFGIPSEGHNLRTAVNEERVEQAKQSCRPRVGWRPETRCAACTGTSASGREITEAAR
jgi:hypothetical protein